MKSNYDLSNKIVDFLKRKNWRQVKMTEYSYELIPPDDFTFSKEFTLSIGYKNKASDYCIHIDRILEILSQIYPDKNSLGTLQVFKNKNDNIRNKFLGFAKWIKPEKKSQIKQIDPKHIYIPNFSEFSLRLLME